MNRKPLGEQQMAIICLIWNPFFVTSRREKVSGAAVEYVLEEAGFDAACAVVVATYVDEVDRECGTGDGEVCCGREVCCQRTYYLIARCYSPGALLLAGPVPWGELENSLGGLT